jgi:uncharacterized protein
VVDPGLPETIVIIFISFVLAGFVKGVVGLGLPTVSLGLLTATLGLTNAIALMLAPTFVTNVWQALVGGAFLEIMRRLWMLLVAAGVGIWLGTQVLARGNTTLLSGLLGLLICAYAVFGLVTIKVPSPGRREAWLSPTIGAVNGVLTGLTGSYMVPGVLYLQALGMPRDVLIQAMGILFTVSTAALAVALADNRLLSMELGTASAVAIFPAFMGMALGQRVRNRLSEKRFRRVFNGALLMLGGYIVGKAFL